MTKIAVVPCQPTPTNNANERAHSSHRMAVSYLCLGFLGLFGSGLTLIKADTASSNFRGDKDNLFLPAETGWASLSDRDRFPLRSVIHPH